MDYLFILNDAPYGTERSYNALRLANSLAKDNDTSLSIFLMGDAVGCALSEQSTPDGYYDIERMLKFLASKGHNIGVCGSCIDARGIKTEILAQGVHRSSMVELTQWTIDANKVIVF
jgi:uncharacterized protein involved in oxidation of intracellular sulfur